MKKVIRFILFCCGIFLTHNLLAQTGWRLGMQVSPLFTAVLNKTDRNSPDSVFKADDTWGVSAGISGGYNFSNHFGIGMQALYSSQGQHNFYNYSHLQHNKVEQIEVKNELRLRYFKFPLLARFTTNSQKKYAGVFEVGPQIEILSSVDERNSDTRSNPFDPPYRNDLIYTNFPNRKLTINNVNLGLMGSVGLDIKLRYNIKMVSGIRVDYTLNDIENKNINYVVTRNGFSKETPYYSQETRANFGPNRASSANLTVSAIIGFHYIFVKKIDY